MIASVKDINPGWIALIVAIVGWLVTFRLSVVAQRRQFLNSVLNEARKDIVRAIRTEQSGLGSLSTGFFTVALPRVHELDWKAEATKMDALLAATTADLTIVMEEYENLFPKMVRCRGQLGKRRMALYARAGTLIGNLRRDQTRAEVLGQARSFADEIQAFQIALDDLRIYVQNDTLGRITRHEAPRRRLKTERLQIVVGDDGHLEIKDAKQ